MADAIMLRKGGIVRKTAAATVAGGEVHQLPDGRASWKEGLASASAGDSVTMRAEPVQVKMTKAAGFVAKKGNRAYWDHSTNAINYKKVGDRDFYVGRFAEDAASADTTCVVTQNIDPRYDIELSRDGFSSVIAGTAAAGGFGYPVNLGGALVFELTATSEAQKVDALSVDTFAKGAKAFVEGAFRVISDGAGTAVDVSMGVANATHATDADSITESVFIHLDANNTNINAESDDGTTEVVATDTTTDYVEGSALANRVEFWMDFSDPADVQIYVNGSLILPSTVFNINAAVGPLALLVHVEKTSSTDTYKLAIDWLRVRFQE